MSVSQYLLLHIITLIITGPNLESERYWRFHWRGGQLQLNVTRSTSAVCTSQGCSSIATKEKAVQRGRVPAEFHQFHHMIKVCRTLPLIYWSYLIIFDHQSDRTKCIGIGISSSKEQKAVKICQDYIHLHTLNQGYNKFPSTLDFATCMGCSFPLSNQFQPHPFHLSIPCLEAGRMAASGVHELISSTSTADPTTLVSLVCSTRLQGSPIAGKTTKKVLF